MIWLLIFILSIIFFKAGIWFALFNLTVIALKAALLVIVALLSLPLWRWIKWRRV